MHNNKETMIYINSMLCIEVCRKCGYFICLYRASWYYKI